jgi:hypothetical protein
MATNKDTCPVCSNPFHGRQKYIKCCGPCASRFHLNCLQFSETEYQFYTGSGVSTFKCAFCVKALRLQQNDDTPVKTRSSSTSDLPKKVISPERALVLPPVSDSDKYEALSVQLRRSISMVFVRLTLSSLLLIRLKI